MVLTRGTYRLYVPPSKHASSRFFLKSQFFQGEVRVLLASTEEIQMVEMHPSSLTVEEDRRRQDEDRKGRRKKARQPERLDKQKHTHTHSKKGERLDQANGGHGRRRRKTAKPTRGGLRLQTSGGGGERQKTNGRGRRGQTSDFGHPETFANNGCFFGLCFFLDYAPISTSTPTPTHHHKLSLIHI